MQSLQQHRKREAFGGVHAFTSMEVGAKETTAAKGPARAEQKRLRRKRAAKTAGQPKGVGIRSDNRDLLSIKALGAC